MMILKRIALNKYGTFGVLIVDDIPFATTLEREWLNNQQGISCIPVGTYICKRVQSPKFGNTFEITNVPNRTSILFHAGNIDDDSHGCVLIGEQFENMNGEPAIISSKKGFAEFLNLLQGTNIFTLRIVEV